VNSRERQMLEILKRGRDEFGYVSVKAEFEAEGTRIDELLRLVELVHRARLELTVKIGGCEAVRDLLESRQIGVRYIVAPMVETPYALSKYVQAKNAIYLAEERQDTDFLFNIETHTGFQNRQQLAEQATVKDGVQGMVFGRVDYTGSLGVTRESVNDARVTKDVIEIALLCKSRGLDLVVGGGVSKDSIACLRQVAEVHLSRFETRKIVFDGNSINSSRIESGLLEAVHFELLWLLNKQAYYTTISEEDGKRIDMLEARWKVLGAKR